MDAKITKKRLAQMLSYDWVKIVAFAVGAILIWSLIFQMTATRIKPSQKFQVYNYYCNESLGNDFYRAYESMGNNKNFSYEVLEMNITDLSRSEGQHFTQLDAAVQTNDGDLIFVPNVGDENYKTETDGVVTYEYTYVESFAQRYFPYLYDLDLENENGYFKRLEKYLDNFYTGGWEQKETLNEEKVKASFRERVKQNEDKRFKKDEEIERGATWEVERIQKYRDALERFYSYVDEGIVSFTRVELKSNGQTYASGVFGLNICPDVSKTGELKKLVSYKDINDVSTAKDMNVLFFKFGAEEDSFEYEGLICVNLMIEKAKTETAKIAAAGQQ